MSTTIGEARKLMRPILMILILSYNNGNNVRPSQSRNKKITYLFITYTRIKFTTVKVRNHNVILLIKTILFTMYHDQLIGFIICIYQYPQEIYPTKCCQCTAYYRFFNAILFFTSYKITPFKNVEIKPC